MKHETLSLTLLACFLALIDSGVAAELLGPQAKLPEIIWGEATNGVKMGLAFYSRQRGCNPLCLIYLHNTGTNLMRFNYPDISQMLVRTLRDPAGKPVKTTRLGKRQGEPLDTKANARNRPHMWAGSFGEPGQARSFLIDDLFIVEKAADYELEVHVKLFLDDRSKWFKPFILRPVKTTIHLFRNVN